MMEMLRHDEKIEHTLKSSVDLPGMPRISLLLRKKIKGYINQCKGIKVVKGI